MCVYCNMGDSWFRHDPPWQPPYPSPLIPLPVNPAPTPPWSLEKLKEYYGLLKMVRKLEEQVGCPCEPNKADYLKILEERIDNLDMG